MPQSLKVLSSPFAALISSAYPVWYFPFWFCCRLFANSVEFELVISAPPSPPLEPEMVISSPISLVSSPVVAGGCLVVLSCFLCLHLTPPLLRSASGSASPSCSSPSCCSSARCLFSFALSLYQLAHARPSQWLQEPRLLVPRFASWRGSTHSTQQRKSRAPGSGPAVRVLPLEWAGAGAPPVSVMKARSTSTRAPVSCATGEWSGLGGCAAISGRKS